MNHPGNAANLSEAERAAWIERVRGTFAEKRARGEIEVPPSTEEKLEELEQDASAGRTVKFDLRVAPEEKIRWARAASMLGLTSSEFVRDVVASACNEIEAADDPLSDENLLRAIGVG